MVLSGNAGVQNVCSWASGLHQASVVRWRLWSASQRRTSEFHFGVVVTFQGSVSIMYLTSLKSKPLSFKICQVCHPVPFCLWDLGSEFHRCPAKSRPAVTQSDTCFPPVQVCQHPGKQLQHPDPAGKKRPQNSGSLHRGRYEGHQPALSQPRKGHFLCPQLTKTYF